uniref:3-phosphoinositide-dependent protein kinase 1 n=1 Tax=Hirondellea gigas TaxID=1518452 RepID=A0A2P2I227_9CRUS
MNQNNSALSNGNPEQPAGSNDAREAALNSAQKKSATKGKSSSKKSDKRCENDFIFGKLIGEGSFSSVYLAKDIQTQQEYAAKVVPKLLVQKEKKVASVMREKEIMNLLNMHENTTAPFFVRLAFAFQSDVNLYFILSYCKHKEFLGLIQQVGNFDHESARFYTGEIVRALEHLHALNIVHRDLKPENILLDENMHIKISDFGSARILEKVENDGIGVLRASSFVGTAQYVSPEVLHEKQVCLASDLWSLGCIIYQIVSGLPPFRAKSEYMIFKSIQNLKYEFPQGFFDDAKDMVEQLLVLDSMCRLGAGDIPGRYSSLREHPFLASLDLDTLYTITPPTIMTFTPDIDDDQNIWDNSIAPGLEERELDLLHQLVISKKPTPTPAQLQPRQPLQQQQSPKQKQQSLTQSKSSTTQDVRRTDEPDKKKSPSRKISCPNMSYSSSSSSSPPTGPSRGRRNVADITQEEHDKRLAVQEKDNKWHKFVEGNLILKQGMLYKRKGLFPRRRMFLLTTGPHLYYVDPDSNVLKGQVPFSATLRPEGKNFRTFFVHTPHRTYYLEDPSNTSQQWMQTLEEVRDYYFSSHYSSS